MAEEKELSANAEAEAVAQPQKSDDNQADTENKSNDVEFKDGPTEEVGTAVPTAQEEDKKPQSKEENAEFARKRREAELQQRIAKATSEARLQATIEALDGMNPYTNQPIKDEKDVEEFRLMQKIKKDGGDPVADYSRYQKEESRKQDEEVKKAETQKEWYRNDAENFHQRYPDVKLNELIEDEAFAKYAEGKVGITPLADIYEGFSNLISSTRTAEQKKAAQTAANASVSVGSLKGQAAPDSDYYTQEQVKKMSAAEIHANYDKIRQSMTHWNK